MPARPTIQPKLDYSGPQAGNWQELRRVFAELCAVAGGVVTDEIDLAIGDNAIVLPGAIKNPQGRITVYQNGLATIYDVGLNDAGRWVVNSDANVTVRFLFF